MKVQGKIAIVTGASSGFGKELAIRLASLGGKLVLVDITEPDGRALEATLNAKYEKCCIFVRCDVTKKDQLQQVFDAAKNTFGQIDIVVNNAGITEPNAFDEDTDDTWMKVLDINLMAVILGTRMAITEFKRQGRDHGGLVINTASLAGLYALASQPVYSATKGGVVLFTRAMGLMAEKHGIRINAICPSFSPTPLLKAAMSEPDAIPKEMLVPVDLVIDAFMMVIDDDKINGGCVRVTPEFGIDVVPRGADSRDFKIPALSNL